MIIRDVHLMVSASDVEILPGVAEAFAKAQAQGYAIIVVTNQSVVARGLCTEWQLQELHRGIDQMLQSEGCAPLDAYSYCAHHPDATVAAYREVCQCRKPQPGMLLTAAAEHSIDLARSVMIGDRLTDILAGHKAGCRAAVQVLSDASSAPILSHVDTSELVEPSYKCDTLVEAIEWALAPTA